MRDDVDLVLNRCGRAAARSTFLRNGVSSHAVDNEVKAGHLVRLATDVYCRPWDADDTELRERATLLALGRATALSHVTGLRRWDLLDGIRTDDRVHVTVPARRAPRSSERLAVHRVSRFPNVVRLRGLVTVDAATAAVTSWPLLAADDRRAPLIGAVRRRLTTPAQLHRTLAVQPRIRGRAELARLISLLEAGCESELEIWGHDAVFDSPGLRHGRAQHWVTADGKRFRLDLAYVEERVAVEMDGRRFHSGVEQREHDMRRDALLAAAGWVVLRFSHHRLHHDVSGCRRDTLGALAARQR